MEKKQSDLCRDVLNRFFKAGILEDVILIGSWCIPLYKKYYLKTSLISPLRTMDIDFFVPDPSSIKTSVSIPDILQDLGFILDFVGDQGYIRLIHPDLIVEFLVQEKGRGTDKPYPLPSLGLNAQPLRFLSLLSEKIIKVNVNGIIISIPHPAWFAIHKLIVTQRRTKVEKADKDLTVAIALLHDLINMKQSNFIIEAFNLVSKKWQNKIIELLKRENEHLILKIVNLSRLQQEVKSLLQKRKLSNDSFNKLFSPFKGIQSKQLIEKENELIFLKGIISDQGLDIKNIQYEPKPKQNSKGKTIDFLLKINDKYSVYCELKTIHPDQIDASDKLRKSKKHIPENHSIIADGISWHHMNTSRAKMLEYTLEMENKIKSYKKNNTNKFILIFCSSGYHWSLDEIEDFADYYSTEKYNPDDSFSKMEKYYLTEKNIKFTKSIDRFGYMEIKQNSYIISQFQCPVKGPWITNRWHKADKRE